MFSKLTLDFHCWWAQSKLPLTSLIEIWHMLKRKIIDSGHKGNSASNNAQKINHSIWQKCTFDSHPVSRRASLVAQRLKRLPAMQETRVWSLGREDPLEKEMGRSPGEGNGNPLQYSCLGNSMDRWAWWPTVHGAAKSQTQLSDFTSLCQGKPFNRAMPRKCSPSKSQGSMTMVETL